MVIVSPSHFDFLVGVLLFDPGQEFLHGRMRFELFKRIQFACEVLVGKQSVQLTMAGAAEAHRGQLVNFDSGAAPLRFWEQMMHRQAVYRALA